MAEVKISENRYTVDSLFQWDKNQMLYIYGVTGVKSPEIHFANGEMGRTIVRTPSVDSKGVISVEVPNSLLQKSLDINVYICGYEGETFKTYYKIVVPVKARTKPSDYTLDLNDGEVYSFNAIEKELNDVKTIVKNNENLVKTNEALCRENSNLMNEALETISHYDEAIANIETIDKNVTELASDLEETSQGFEEANNGKADIDGSNLTDENVESWKTKLDLSPLSDYDESKGTIEERLTALGFTEGSATLGSGISATLNQITKQGHYAIFKFEGTFSGDGGGESGVYYLTLPSEFIPKESFSTRVSTPSTLTGITIDNTTLGTLYFEALSETVEFWYYNYGTPIHPISFQIGYEVEPEDDGWISGRQ